MSKEFIPNHLNVFGIRKVRFIPPYFENTSIPMTYNLEESIDRWIDSNLKGRYYLGKSTSLVNNKLETTLKIGFEQPKEMSYFMLACPHLKYK